MKYTIFLFVTLFSCCKVVEPFSSKSKTIFTLKGSDFTYSQPNVIFILSDDVGYEVPTVDSGGTYETPNIDAWANSNARFTQCHSLAKCSPSRFELMTGKYTFPSVYPKWGDMPLTTKTFGNMFNDAGYATGVYGKWQLNNGEEAVHAFGFDNYTLFNPYQTGHRGRRYKNPLLYANGKDTQYTHNEYGEDILTDSVKAFVLRNRNNKFFCYYPMGLCHEEFQPTPDDAEYLSFDQNSSDVKFYPSMVKYMDKKVKEIIDYVDSLGIADNTIIVFTGDNGSPHGTKALYNGVLQSGGKGKTTEMGMHVPLVIQWRNHLSGVYDQLIGFEDFLSTLSDMCGIPNSIPTDGHSFYSGAQKDWLFTYYDESPTVSPDSEITMKVQNSIYGVYSSSLAYPSYKKGRMIRLKLVKETEPQFIDTLTNAQLKIYNRLNYIMDSIYSSH